MAYVFIFFLHFVGTRGITYAPERRSQVSVKHKIVFALQCISMAIFQRRGHSQFGTGKNDDEHKYTKLYDFIFFLTNAILYRDLAERVRNSNEQ